MTDHDPLAQRMVPCPECKGRGSLLYGGRIAHFCYTCGGKKQVPEPAPMEGLMSDHDPLAQRLVTCHRCKGAGVIEKHYPSIYSEYDVETRREVCSICNGTGRIPENWQATAERNAAIARWLADHPGFNACNVCNARFPHCSYGEGDKLACRNARLLAAEKATEASQ